MGSKCECDETLPNTLDIPKNLKKVRKNFSEALEYTTTRTKN